MIADEIQTGLARTGEKCCAVIMKMFGCCLIPREALRVGRCTSGQKLPFSPDVDIAYHTAYGDTECNSSNPGVIVYQASHVKLLRRDLRGTAENTEEL